MNSPVVINGWTIFAHPLFLDQYKELADAVDRLKTSDPENYKKKNDTKQLAAIHKLAFETIPQDPESPNYRQGKALGDNYKHWFRAKFFQQYRLFFRFDSKSKVIIYAWVNDDGTKRAYGSKTDAYKVFGSMLKTGNPPDSWEDLKKESERQAERLDQLIKHEA